MRYRILIFIAVFAIASGLHASAAGADSARSEIDRLIDCVYDPAASRTQNYQPTQPRQLHEPSSGSEAYLSFRLSPDSGSHHSFQWQPEDRSFLSTVMQPEFRSHSTPERWLGIETVPDTNMSPEAGAQPQGDVVFLKERVLGAYSPCVPETVSLADIVPPDSQPRICATCPTIAGEPVTAAPATVARGLKNNNITGLDDEAENEILDYATHSQKGRACNKAYFDSAEDDYPDSEIYQIIRNKTKRQEHLKKIQDYLHNCVKLRFIEPLSYIGKLNSSHLDNKQIIYNHIVTFRFHSCPAE